MRVLAQKNYRGGVPNTPLPAWLGLNVIFIFHIFLSPPNWWEILLIWIWLFYDTVSLPVQLALRVVLGLFIYLSIWFSFPHLFIYLFIYLSIISIHLSIQVGEWRGFLSDEDRDYIDKFNLNNLMYSGTDMYLCTHVLRYRYVLMYLCTQVQICTYVLMY